MKKIIIPLTIWVAVIFAGVALNMYAKDKTGEIMPIPFSNLRSNDIYSGLYVTSDETIVYEKFAYYGESEYNSETDYYITVTGIDTEDGAQYIAFGIPSSQAFMAEEHLKKTLIWEQDETMATPTGYPITGVVKEMTTEIKQYFYEFFIDAGWFTQEDINDYPELFSEYYIDTEAAPNTYDRLFDISHIILGLAPLSLVAIIIVTAANRNKRRYARENAVENTTNINLEDSTKPPLGFDK